MIDLGRHKKHGMSNTRIYQIWADMKDRCFNENNKFYKRYGGRGITVCDEWSHDFQTFYDWAISNGYSDNLTIDRKDNDGNYEPSNCRWSTQHEQSMNKKHLPNKTGFVGVRARRRKGEVYGYIAIVYRHRKELYAGFAKTPEEAFLIREKYIKENGL